MPTGALWELKVYLFQILCSGCRARRGLLGAGNLIFLNLSSPLITVDCGNSMFSFNGFSAQGAVTTPAEDLHSKNTSLVALRKKQGNSLGNSHDNSHGNFYVNSHGFSIGFSDPVGSILAEYCPEPTHVEPINAPHNFLSGPFQFYIPPEKQ